MKNSFETYTWNHIFLSDGEKRLLLFGQNHQGSDFVSKE